jgi:hypothetical protein
MSPQPAASKQPNLFELSGDGIHITYSATSFDGQPRFSYQDASETKQFVGNQIRTEKTVVGTLVSVTIAMTPDAGSTTFTVLIPTVNLRVSDSANITTYGLTTLHKFSIIGAPQGQTELYTTHPLQGTALWVVF